MKKYYDEVVLLLETGLRISEFCGLTTHIDMQNRILNIDHQLLKDSEMGYYIETPKTKNGKRELPLTERAYQAIQRIYYSFTTFGCIFMLVNASLCKVSSKKKIPIKS